MNFQSINTYLKKTRTKGRCSWKHCTRKARSDSHRFCHKHQHQYKKITNPYAYYYNTLKSNARRRKIAFKLTLEEFKNFCLDTNYINKKGRKKDSLTIDRIKNWLGYEAGNIQVLENGQNSRKKYIDMKIAFGRYPTDEELKELYGGMSIEELATSNNFTDTADNNNNEIPF